MTAFNSGFQLKKGLFRKGHLVDLLLVCPSIQNAESRHALLRELPSHIANAIKTGDTHKVHVLNIVNSCISHAGGLELLLDTLRFFDGETTQFQALIEFINEPASKSEQSSTNASSSEMKDTNLANTDSIKAGSYNPYVVGNSVGGSSAFVGRDDILQEVHKVLRNPQQNTILLHGQRRIGKTSILRELEANLPKKGNYCPVFFDLLGKAHQPFQQVLQILANEISKMLEREPPVFGNDPKTQFCKIWLPELLGDLCKETSLVLLFDEFDALDDDKSKQASDEFFCYLRDELLSVNPRKLNFVFVIGRNIDDLTNNIALSLFRCVLTKRVSLLNREDTIKLIHFSVKNKTLLWSGKAEEKVWQLTEGHPYLTQLLCFHIWNGFYDKNHTETPMADPAHIEKAVPDALENAHGALEWLWTGLQPAQKIVISALAEAGTCVISKEQLQDSLNEVGIQVQVPELEIAPRSLAEDWDLIESIEGKGYRFRVELLRRWIAKYKPFQSMKRELDRIQPEADSYYLEGLNLYTNKQLEAALEKLQRAIRTNPNHVEASKLSAKIFLEQGKIVEARNKLEELYKYQPDATRALLIQALWISAQFCKKESEQHEYYDRILVLDNNHAKAKNKKQEISRRRGDIAFKEGDLREALRAYQEAGKKEKIAQIKKAIFLGIYLKRILEVSGFALPLLISYFMLGSYSPEAIILEVEQHDSEYKITSNFAGTEYLLESARLCANASSVEKISEFQYGTHKPIRISETIFPTGCKKANYSYTYNALKKDLSEEFTFTRDKLFSFLLRFKGSKTEKVDFMCEVMDDTGKEIVCEVKEKGYLSLFRGIPWFLAGSIFGIIFFLSVEIGYLIKNRKRDDVY